MPVLAEGDESGKGNLVISWVAVGIVMVPTLALITLIGSDHITLTRLTDQMDEVKLRLLDQTTLVKLVAHMEYVDQHLLTLDKEGERSIKADEASITERNELRYRMNNVEERMRLAPTQPLEHK